MTDVRDELHEMVDRILLDCRTQIEVRYQEDDIMSAFVTM